MVTLLFQVWRETLALSVFTVCLKFTEFWVSLESLAWVIHCGVISRSKEVLVTLAATEPGNILILAGLLALIVFRLRLKASTEYKIHRRQGTNLWQRYIGIFQNRKTSAPSPELLFKQQVFSRSGIFYTEARPSLGEPENNRNKHVLGQIRSLTTNSEETLPPNRRSRGMLGRVNRRWRSALYANLNSCFLENSKVSINMNSYIRKFPFGSLCLGWELRLLSWLRSSRWEREVSFF